MCGACFGVLEVEALEKEMPLCIGDVNPEMSTAHRGAGIEARFWTVKTTVPEIVC